MAATIPSATIIENAGSNTLYIVTFPATADDTNTWDSGFGTQVVAFWGQTIDNPTQTKEGVDIEYSATAGTSPKLGQFTFNLGEDNVAFTLFVLTKN